MSTIFPEDLVDTLYTNMQKTSTRTGHGSLTITKDTFTEWVTSLPKFNELLLNYNLDRSLLNKPFILRRDKHIPYDIPNMLLVSYGNMMEVTYEHVQYTSS